MKTKTISVECAIVDMHAELAVKNFKDHVATQRLDQGMFRSWRCQQPGTWVCGFDVTTTPGYLLITGDIGELVISRSEDMIAWARGSVNSISYFAEKVPRSIPTREWSFDKSVEWIEDEIAEAVDYHGEEDAPEYIAKMQELLYALKNDGINGEMGEHEFCTALYESGAIDGCDWPDLEVFNSNFLWCREAVKWLLNSLEAAK